jgi:hypothetical protein
MVYGSSVEAVDRFVVRVSLRVLGGLGIFGVLGILWVF